MFVVLWCLFVQNQKLTGEKSQGCLASSRSNHQGNAMGSCHFLQSRALIELARCYDLVAGDSHWRLQVVVASEYV